MKVLIMVIDGFGIGEMPDADKYGDMGSNSFLNCYRMKKFNIPNLEKMGILNIQGINMHTDHNVMGSYSRLESLSVGKDSITGHQEMMGIINKEPMIVFNKIIPQIVVDLIENEIGNEVICKKPISGTVAIEKYGKEHLETRKPILYTSADSVIQIAAHTDIYSLDEIYKMCSKLRKVLIGDYKVGRVIARPFSGNAKEGFYRTPDRKDYALNPTEKSFLELINNKGYKTISVGKVESMFNGIGFDESYPGKSNIETIDSINNILSKDFKGIVFANLPDTDTTFGHRNDVDGYIKSVEEIDKSLPEVISRLGNDDILIITSDHGNDPTTPSTDHSREYVPMLIYGKTISGNIDLGTLSGLDVVGKIALEKLGIYKKNILNKLER